AIIFHLLCGRPPFVGNSVMALLKKQIEDPVPPLRSFRPDAPAALERFVGRLMQKEPDARFPDAGAALAELDRIRAQVERMDRAPTPSRRAALGPLERGGSLRGSDLQARGAAPQVRGARDRAAGRRYG